MSVPFVSGEDGYNTYRIPSLVKTSDGALIALAEGRVNSGSDTGNIDIVAKRSSNSGETWSALSVVTSHGTNTAGNPCVVLDPTSGDIVLLSCRNGEDDTSEEIRSGAVPPRRVYVQRGTDSGTSWTPPVEISSSVRPEWMRWYATGPGHGVAVSGTGRLVIPCNHSRTPTGTDLGTEEKYKGGHCIYSDDGGINWSLGFTSSNANGTINEDEATVCETLDGRLYFNCRCAPDERAGNRANAYSATEGQTLEVPYLPQATLTTPIVQGSVISTPYGLVFSCPSLPDERAALALWTSTDNGNTWYLKKYITGLLSAYSDLILLDFNTIGVLYETGSWKLYERIEFTTVSLMELF